MTTDAIAFFEKRLATTLNMMGKTNGDSDGCFDLLDLGLSAMEEKLKSEGKKVRNHALSQELERERASSEEKRLLARLYEKKGLDNFVEYCKQEGIEWEPFLMEYDLERATSSTRSQRIRRFLDISFRDVSERSASELKEIAERDGIINCDEDWNLMKVVAHNDGYTTGTPGKWRKREGW
jgi:hypothetical protein